MKKRVIALLLAASLLCTSFIGCSSSSSSESSDDDSSTSTDSDSEEEEEVVEQSRAITIAVGVSDEIGDVEDLYSWKYLDYLTDTEFEVEHILNIDSSITSYKQLAFAAGTMPDVMLNMAFSTSDIMTYGVSEGQLVSLSEYVEDGTMDSLALALEDYPDAYSVITAADGEIYSTGLIDALIYEDGSLTGTMHDYSIKQTWLDEAGLETPETLDEFIDMLRAFKDLYPDSTPFGGSYEASSGLGIIASALGIVYYNNDNNLCFTNIALVDDEATFIWGDQELYEPFLETLITMYSEGLMSQDYFTMDSTTVKAQAADGQYGVLGGGPVITYDGTNFADYWSGVPLTSDYNDTQIWTLTQSNYTMGVAVISSNCENPELAADLIDYWYDPEIAFRMAAGATEADDEEILFDYSGLLAVLNDDGSYAGLSTYAEVESGEYASTLTYRASLISSFGWNLGYYPNNKEWACVLLGYEYETTDYDITTAAGARRQSAYDCLIPYSVMGYPQTTYFDADTTESLTDLESVLVDYAEMQFAQFVTGLRSIDELDDYFAELDAMGYQEYLAYYYDYYESTK